MRTRRTARDIVYDELCAAIVTWEIEPGQRLGEEELAERLGVSRTPVREAIRRLELERLVVREANGQAFAASVSETDAERVFAVRVALEVVAARAACENMGAVELSALADALSDMQATAARGERLAVGDAGKRFHEILREASNNAPCQAFLVQLQPHVDRYRRLTTVSERRAEEAVAEHEQLLGALELRDADRVAAILARHLDAGRRTAVEALRARGAGKLSAAAEEVRPVR